MSQGRPAADETRVLARHPQWSGMLCFDEAAGRVRLAANNAHASYSAVPGGLLLLWDDYPAERFVALDGHLIQASLVADPPPGLADPPQQTILVRAPGTDLAVALRWPGDDPAAFQRAFQKRDYDTPRLPRAAETVVDLDAGVGLAALALAGRYPDARVYAVAPDPEERALLVRNFAQAGGRCVAVDGEAGRSVAALISGLGLDRVDVLRIGRAARLDPVLAAGMLDGLDRVGTVLFDAPVYGNDGREALSRLLRDRGFAAPRRAGDALIFDGASAGRAERIAVKPSRRTLMVTPYYKEDAATLRRCIESVRAQNQATDHMLVADGHPQAWIDAMPVRHLKLDRAHGDYGNTPRGVGALLAISEDYDGIGFLDADNWLEPDHVEECYEAADRGRDVDYVVARCLLRRPAGTVIPFAGEPGHVDTNCFFMLPGSYHVIPHFSMMPQELSPIGDRVFYAAVRAAGLASAEVAHPTVNYSCLWEGVYRAVGEALPPEAKPSIDSSKVDAWIKARTPRALDIVGRRAGVRIA